MKTARDHNIMRLNKLIQGLDYQQTTFDVNDELGAEVADMIQNLNQKCRDLLKDIGEEYKPRPKIKSGIKQEEDWQFSALQTDSVLGDHSITA